MKNYNTPDPDSFDHVDDWLDADEEEEWDDEQEEDEEDACPARGGCMPDPEDFD